VWLASVVRRPRELDFLAVPRPALGSFLLLRLLLLLGFL
jgi:hypothetical protein